MGAKQKLGKQQGPSVKQGGLFVMSSLDLLPGKNRRG